MKLSTRNVVSYSPKEKEVFRLLSRKPQTSISIVEKLYGRNGLPINGRQIIIGVLKILDKKVRMNKEPFVIRRTERSGPIPVSFWIEPRR